METFSGWFSGKTAPDKEPASTLLSDWKSYESTTMTTGSKNQSASVLLSSAEEGAASITKIASGALSSVTAVSSTVVGSVQRWDVVVAVGGVCVEMVVHCGGRSSNQCNHHTGVVL